MPSDFRISSPTVAKFPRRFTAYVFSCPNSAAQLRTFYIVLYKCAHYCCHYEAAWQYYVRRCGLLLQTEQCALSVCHDHEPCKTAEPIEMPFGMWTQMGPRKHVLDEVHIGGTWRIRFNRPCAAAMRPFCRMTLSSWLRVSAADGASSGAEGDERAVQDVDCVMCLGVAFHDLQLVRVEQHLSAVAAVDRRPPGNQTDTVRHRRLLLGDVHTDPAQRVLYRPMGFQPALVPHQVHLASARLR